jgi:aryl-alcohol dehydrogenase-like predicted oxidoreductase
MAMGKVDVSMNAGEIPIRTFGASGLRVPAIGLGAGPLGDAALDERDVESLVLRALERGVTLFDTARSYFLSEERLGRILEGRPGAILSTKVGYGVEGHADWTGACVAAGIDRALRVLRRDHVEIVHLHSCPASVLAREDVLRALDDAKSAGKIGVAAYSGEEEDLDAAIETGRFGAVQISISLCDQRSLHTRASKLAGLGVIAKRAIANAPWRYESRPDAHDVGEYWDRFRALELGSFGMSFSELSLRFAAFSAPVSTALIGTRSIAHLDVSIDAIARGPLPDVIRAAIEERWRAVAHEWRGVI